MGKAERYAKLMKAVDKANSPEAKRAAQKAAENAKVEARKEAAAEANRKKEKEEEELRKKARSGTKGLSRSELKRVKGW
jgi:hypothetical protein